MFYISRIFVHLLPTCSIEEPHFIGFPAIPGDQVGVGGHPVLRKFPADRFRMYKSQELLPVRFCHILFGIARHGFQVREMFPVFCGI